MSTLHVSIIIADHHTIIRHGISQLLTKDPGHKISARVSTGKELVKAVAEFNPAMVILDMLLPFLNGTQGIQQLIAANPGLAVIVLCSSADPKFVKEIMDAGAKGYVMKTGPPGDITEAVKTVLRGNLYYSSQISELMK